MMENHSEHVKARTNGIIPTEERPKDCKDTYYGTHADTTTSYKAFML